MTKSLTVAELRPLILAGKFSGVLPHGAAAEMLGLSKGGLIRKLGTGNGRLKTVTITSASGTSWSGVTLESLAEELDFLENHRPRTLKLVKLRLRELAKAGAVSSYGDFMEDVGLNWRNPHHRALTGQLLGEVSETMWEQAKVMPSALVVNKSNQRPSSPFFELAEKIGAYDPTTQSDATFFELMKSKVFASARQAALWK